LPTFCTILKLCTLYAQSLFDLQKPSTRDGFRPPRIRGLTARRLAMEALRLDGQLDVLRVHPRIHLSTFRHARMENALSTYEIEGFHVGRDEAERAFRGEKTVRPVARDVAVFAKKYEELHSAIPTPRITLKLIRDLHASLFTADTLDSGAPGAWKTKPNGVYDTHRQQWVFHATPPEDTEAELAALLRWFEDEAPDLPPAWAAALFFAEFEAIHPFPDGNGRIGRLLNLLALKHLGHENAFLVPLDQGFLARQDATTNDGQDLSAWAEFYGRELVAAYKRALDWSDRGRNYGKPLRPLAREVLEWALVEAPERWFRRGDHPNPHAYSDSALTQALAELVGAGLLESEGERKARRYRLRVTPGA
jgi:hypothetical protein